MDRISAEAPPQTIQSSSAGALPSPLETGLFPVAKRQANPNTAAFAEVHAIIEPPFIYPYHTLRPEYHGGEDFPWVEDLGVQILVTETPFSLEMPALYRESLGPNQVTALEDAPPICLRGITRLSLTAECTYGKKAKRPIRIHVRGSYDGIRYDTTDLYTLDNDLKAGQLARRTFELNSKACFIKVMVENPDKNERVTGLLITAALGG